METLALNPNELRMLRMVLQSRLSGLISEIDHTDSRAFRELLRDQATLLENLLARMPSRPQG